MRTKDHRDLRERMARPLRRNVSASWCACLFSSNMRFLVLATSAAARLISPEATLLISAWWNLSDAASL